MSIWQRFRERFRLAAREYSHTPNPPHHLNVPGDYYVETNCCTACGIVMDIAPGHFAWDNPHLDIKGNPTGDNCYVCKQPSTPEELDNMILALACSEVGCVRYRGSDPAIISRIQKESGIGFCDSEIKSD